MPRERAGLDACEITPPGVCRSSFSACKGPVRPCHIAPRVPYTPPAGRLPRLPRTSASSRDCRTKRQRGLRARQGRRRCRRSHRAFRPAQRALRVTKACATCYRDSAGPAVDGGRSDEIHDLATEVVFPVLRDLDLFLLVEHHERVDGPLAGVVDERVRVSCPARSVELERLGDGGRIGDRSAHGEPAATSRDHGARDLGF